MIIGKGQQRSDGSIHIPPHSQIKNRGDALPTNIFTLLAMSKMAPPEGLDVPVEIDLVPGEYEVGEEAEEE